MLSARCREPRPSQFSPRLQVRVISTSNIYIYLCCPGRPKKLCFTTPSLTPMVSTARLDVVKQSSFGLPGQYGRRVTRANCGPGSIPGLGVICGLSLLVLFSASVMI